MGGSPAARVLIRALPDVQTLQPVLVRRPDPTTTNVSAGEPEHQLAKPFWKVIYRVMVGVRDANLFPVARKPCNER